jgi:hypothetical protein
MRRDNRVHFFCSVQKKEAETQTAFLSHPDAPAPRLIDRLRSSDREAVLLRQLRSFTPTAPAIIDGYNSRLSLYAAAISDPRFDMLTPPPDLFENLHTVTFEFCDDAVIVTSPEGDAQQLSYRPIGARGWPLFEPFETQLLTYDLAIYLKKLKCKFENGFLFCRCVDRRFSPNRVTHLFLLVGPEVVARELMKARAKEPLDAERQVLALQRPVVCTDPSPDVARVQSILDFRRKMWLNQGERVREADVVRQAPAPRPPPPRAPAARVSESRRRVDIPEDIQRLCVKF